MPRFLVRSDGTTLDTAKKKADTLDLDNNAVTQISEEHEKVHRGQLYSINHFFPATAVNADNYLLMSGVAGYSLHVSVSATTSGANYVYLMEDAVVSGHHAGSAETVFGTSVSGVNMNRDYRNTPPHWKFFHTPTLSGAHISTTNSSGVTLMQVAGYGGAGPSTKVGGIARKNSEFVLNKEKVYMVIARNLCSTASDVVITVEAYEVAE